MTEQPYDVGGYLKPGLSPIVNNAGKPEVVIGKQIFARLENGTIIGPGLIESVAFSHSETDWSAEIVASPMSFSRSITLEQIPPKTRREKLGRNAFMRLIYGGPLPKPQPRRQLIHKGGKP